MGKSRKNTSEDAIKLVFGLLVMIAALMTIHTKFKEQIISGIELLYVLVIIVFSIGISIHIYKIKKKKESTINKSINTISKNDNIQYSQASRPLKLKWSKELLSSIEWKRFEILSKEFFRIMGYDARETNIGADGGVDIKIFKDDKLKIIVQCKAWNTKVGVKVVRELFGVMTSENLNNGVILTSNSFTDEAENFAKGKKLMLISGDKFLEKIRSLPEEKQQTLLDIATEGDYTTPTCPNCDLKMILRESKKGKNQGTKFWGCVRYPRCKHIFAYKGT